MKKSLVFFVLISFSMIFVSFTSADDLSPYASTKVFLDNIKDYPEYTFFISIAADECYWESMRTNFSSAPRVVDNEKMDNCELKLFDDSGALLNFFKSSKGGRGQCLSPVYAIKSVDFNAVQYKEMSVCDQADFLKNNTVQVTRSLDSVRRASSYFVYLIEEHYTINFDNINPKTGGYILQVEPSEVVEKSRLGYILAGLAVVALIVILIIVFIFRRRK